MLYLKRLLILLAPVALGLPQNPIVEVAGVTNSTSVVDGGAFIVRTLTVDPIGVVPTTTASRSSTRMIVPTTDSDHQVIPYPPSDNTQKPGSPGTSKSSTPANATVPVALSVVGGAILITAGMVLAIRRRRQRRSTQRLEPMPELNMVGRRQTMTRGPREAPTKSSWMNRSSSVTDPHVSVIEPAKPQRHLTIMKPSKPRVNSISSEVTDVCDVNVDYSLE
jgi:hypothetical protein